ncbi:hypothetical protein [Nocardiopsis salina]|uniref:hypothetical protein n=1 Tax=Nocardiopsis salina TaxID=245836 RepID=UPI000475CE9C|nr:hypothetical protein [Nocardiopsis salina]
MSTKGFGLLPVSSVAAALALALASTACEGDRASQEGPNPGEQPDTPPEEEHDREEIAHVSAELAEEEDGSELFDENAVGEEPIAELWVVDAGADVTSFELEVSGFAENDFYLATVRVDPCGTGPEESGDLYEGDEDTEEAPESEVDEGSVMIQLGTDADGNGTGQVEIDDQPDEGEVGSLLIATDPTSGSEQPAPDDGDPVACLDLELDT